MTAWTAVALPLSHKYKAFLSQFITIHTTHTSILWHACSDVFQPILLSILCDKPLSYHTLTFKQRHREQETLTKLNTNHSQQMCSTDWTHTPSGLPYAACILPMCVQSLHLPFAHSKMQKEKRRASKPHLLMKALHIPSAKSPIHTTILTWATEHQFRDILWAKNVHCLLPKL